MGWGRAASDTCRIGSELKDFSPNLREQVFRELRRRAEDVVTLKFTFRSPMQIAPLCSRRFHQFVVTNHIQVVSRDYNMIAEVVECYWQTVPVPVTVHGSDTRIVFDLSKGIKSAGSRHQYDVDVINTNWAASCGKFLGIH